MSHECDCAAAAREGFVHEALIYDTDEELLSVAVPFLRAGLEADEPSLLSINDRQERLVVDELGGLPGLRLLDKEQYFDPLSALRSNRKLLAGYASRGSVRVRMFGEVPRDPRRRWIRYEAAVNQLFSAFPAWCICPYDSRETPDDVLADVERTHPYLAVPHGRDVLSPRYEEPAALLADRARAEADPLEALAPDVDLADPSAETAGHAVLALAASTRLDRDGVDALRLSVAQVVTNAIVHGRPPVHLRAWAATDRVVVTVHDAGPGPADPYVALLPRDPAADLDEANALHIVFQALTAVSLIAGADGFTVRLLERRTA
jgi:anti-sigma regulatory factor (Ser/Thr protein kinase)